MIALCAGELPGELTGDELTAARFALQLVTHHHVDDDLYQAAEEAFGARGLYDLTAVMGVYQTVCSMMSLFEVPAPVSYQPRSR